MPLLLCPDCLQWREPFMGVCPVCGGVLDISIPDPTLDLLAQTLGDLGDYLGEASVSRKILPKRGQLYSTTHGLLFIPSSSSVFSEYATAQSRHFRPLTWLTRIGPALTGMLRSLRQRFARQPGDPRATLPNDCHAVAELLLSDPGVFFIARSSIASWRRQRGRWDFIRPDARWWPEGITPRGRETDRRLHKWLEETACPLPIIH